MTRKPRRHALSVPVRSGSEVGFPQSLGEVHDMLYDKSLERDNCGFGLIAHIEGEPSHKVVRTAIHALARMQHRGAILADGKTGDGCGLLLQKPDRFFRIVAQERGWRLAKNYAVGMLFLNKDPELAAAARRIVEEELQRETLSIVGWRDVPTNEGVLGEIALSSLPRIEQIFVNAPAGWRPRDMERRLFIARRRIEKRLEADKDFYVCSLSNLVNIYKGLCMPADLPRFYLDLADLRLESAICLFHQRFSTNTVPRWPLAQPFRYLAHNGEINTITGNRQWARARTYKFQTPLIPDLHDAAPFVNETGSDSSSMDNMLELLLAGGMDIIRAMRLLVPPAWQNNPDMDPELRAFFDFNSMHMEPWDGPAGIVMSDGRFAACNLDRNGLRPARYVITKDKLITCASEVGIWDYQPDEVVEKGRVGPGELMVIGDIFSMTAQNPLIGPNLDAFGPRFPDMSCAFDKELRALAHACAGEQGFALREGVYAQMTGPTYETPAEIRMLRTLGADAVGMSTVPEVVVARHGGMRVLGVSCITNMAAGILDQPLNHAEVTETANRVKGQFRALLDAVVEKM